MINVAVVGCGIMGANHVRLLSQLPHCDVVAVVDPDPDRGRAVAEAAGADWMPDPSGLVDRAEAAIVAVPTEAHAETGVGLLEAGLHLLVEKPLAPTLDAAARLVDAAKAADRTLMVGHIERFNPAVIELDRLLDDPLHLEFTRIGPYSSRVTTDVVLDLMIHDLDLAVHLAGSQVSSISATGRKVMGDSLDLATALLTFENGVTATLTASRVSQTKVRTIEVTQRDNFVSVDLVRQDVTVHRLHHSEFLSDGGPRYRQSGLVEIPFLDNRGEPLALELKHFLSCVTEERPPSVGGNEGLVALGMALDVRARAGAH